MYFEVYHILLLFLNHIELFCPFFDDYNVKISTNIILQYNSSFLVLCFINYLGVCYETFDNFYSCFSKGFSIYISYLQSSKCVCTTVTTNMLSVKIKLISCFIFQLLSTSGCLGIDASVGIDVMDF